MPVKGKCSKDEHEVTAVFGKTITAFQLPDYTDLREHCEEEKDRAAFSKDQYPILWSATKKLLLFPFPPICGVCKKENANLQSFSFQMFMNECIQCTKNAIVKYDLLYV